ncbi:MAG: hypothetical protein NVS1B6_03130 [Steroidobacteraceae bacterium]
MTEGSSGVILIAVVLGSVLTLIAQVFIELLRDARKSEQLSHAIAGEISALLQIINARGYRQMVKAHLAEAAAGRATILKVRIEERYFSVIEANLQHIGMLPVELPLLVPKFLTLAKSAIEDVSFLNSREWDNKTASELATIYEVLRQVLEDVTATGQEIIAVIAVMYGSPHGRYPAGLRLRMLLRKLSARSPADSTDNR